jgi:glycosyltransferase involved in cell wall biosynthesis
MHLTVIDYVANPGGGVRFTTEVIRALVRVEKTIRIEVVSHGDGLSRYAGLLGDVPGVELRASAPFLSEPIRRLCSVRGGGRLLGLFGVSNFHSLVAPDVLRGGDAIWFPWTHRHRVVGGVPGNVVGSFHDAIMLERDDIVPPRIRRDELETSRKWFTSSARMVVSSRATRDAVTKLFGNDAARRIELIPVAWDHFSAPMEPSTPDSWTWSSRPFLLCPANTSPHKNHEVLLSGVARSQAQIPLVLTGDRADLAGEGRGAQLRAHAASNGLRLGETLHPLGYLTDTRYRRLLTQAWALVMPTLGEGGGSFPVLEAMAAGIPVLCSDIPVMREQLERTGGTVFWFDPRNPADLAMRIDELAARYDHFRARAAAEAQSLVVRTWNDVATEYLALFRAIGKRARD